MGNNVQIYSTNKFEKGVVTVSSGSITKQNALDNQRRTAWISEGSDDSTVETFEVEVGENVDIDTLNINGSNIKSGGVEYWNTSTLAWTAFSPAVSWAATTENDRYDFTEVSTNKIKVTMNTTEIADTEKTMSMLIGSLFMFELIQNPNDTNPEQQVAGVKNYAEDGELFYALKGWDVYKFELSWSNLGATDTVNDYNNLMQLIYTREAFIICICGDTEQTVEPYTWGNIKKVQITSNSVTQSRSAKCASGGYNIRIQLEQVK